MRHYNHMGSLCNNLNVHAYSSNKANGILHYFKCVGFLGVFFLLNYMTAFYLSGIKEKFALRCLVEFILHLSTVFLFVLQKSLPVSRSSILQFSKCIKHFQKHYQAL